MESDLAVNFRHAIELFEEGRDLMLQNFRRRHPDETEAQLRERLRQWLRGADRVYRGRPYSFRYTVP